MIKHHVFYASLTLTMVELLKNGFNQNIFYVSFTYNWSFCSYHFSCDSSFQLQLVKSSWNAVKGWICGQGVAVVGLQVKPPSNPNPPSVAAVSPPIVYRALHLPPPPPAVHRRCIHKQYPGQLPGRVILVFSRATIIRENGGLWGGNGRRRVLSILSLSHLDNHRWDQADGGWIHPTKPRQGIYQFIFEWNIVHWKVVLY